MFTVELDYGQDRDVKRALTLLLIITVSVLTTSWLLYFPKRFDFQLVSQVAPLIITVAIFYLIYRYPDQNLVRFSAVPIIYVLNFTCWSFAIYLDATDPGIVSPTSKDLMSKQFNGMSESIYWLGLFTLNLIVHRYVRFAFFISSVMVLSLVTILFLSTSLSHTYIVALLILLLTATVMSIIGFGRGAMSGDNNLNIIEFDDVEEVAGLDQRMESSSHLDESHHDHRWEAILRELQNEIRNISDSERLFKSALTFLRNQVDVTAAAVGMMQDKNLKLLTSVGNTSYIQNRQLDWSATRLKLLFSNRDAIITRQAGDLYRIDIPVVSGNKAIGIVSLFRTTRKFDSYEMNLSASIVFHSMMALRQSRMQDEIKKLTASQAARSSGSRDKRDQDAPPVKLQSVTELTVYSREQFEQYAQPMLKTAGRSRECSIFIADIDKLDEVSDKHGKDAATALFKRISSMIMSELTSHDLIGRYGKTGFVVLLSQTDLKEARIKAENIRKEVESLKLSYKTSSLSTTLSIGITIVSEPGEKVAAIIRRADMGLFVARENGGNTIKVSL